MTEEGTVFGLQGPNDAGKTTTMRVIMNTIIPGSGTIKLLGQLFQESLKERIGYLPVQQVA